MDPKKICLSLMFLLVTFTVPVNTNVPKNVIIQVNHVCGSNGVQDAKVYVVADIDIRAAAKCADRDVSFEKINMAKFQLPVSYPDEGSSDCVFHQRVGSRVYAVTVVVSYGERSNPVHQHTEEYTLTCTFDPKATSNSSIHNFHENRLIAPVEVQGHAGTEANGAITLTLTDILGNPFTDDVSSGRIVQLKASSSGDESELGVQPTSCNAIATSDAGNKSYAILRGGCGDGLVIPKTSGFTVDGLVARSSFFEGMSIAGFSTISFECNITLCMSNCDGDTCHYNKQRRRRRSVSGTGNTEEPEVRLVKTEIAKPRSENSLSDEIIRSVFKRLERNKIRLQKSSDSERL